VKRYLETVQALKKANTFRKYRAVLERFSEFFTPSTTPQSIKPNFNQYMVHLKKKRKHDNNTVIHNMIIVVQFLKKNGRSGLTRQIDLPEKIAPLPQEYSDTDLNGFFKACIKEEHHIVPDISPDGLSRTGGHASFVGRHQPHSEHH
jgi:site-specific recombinase XerD